MSYLKKLKEIKKTICRRRHKDPNYRELFSRLNELKFSMTDVGNKIDELKQIVLHVEVVKEQVNFKNKEIKNKIKKIPKENPFDFTEFLEKQNEDFEIDLSLFLNLAEELKIIYNQTPVNTLIEDMEKLKNGF